MDGDALLTAVVIIIITLFLAGLLSQGEDSETRRLLLLRFPSGEHPARRAADG